MLGLNIKNAKRQTIFVQIKMYNGKSNRNYLSTRAHFYENLKPKLSMPLPPNLDELVEELKRVHLQCTFGWMLFK